MLGLLSILTVTIPSYTKAQPKNSILSQPNTIFNVVSQAGKCPKTVGIWNMYHQDDTTAVYTVVADTLFIGGEVAGFAKLVSLKSKWAKFEAPLPNTYKSCIGKTNSETYPQYEFKFNQGKVTFSVDLTKVFISDVFEEKIIYAKPTIGRPYVIWSQD